MYDPTTTGTSTTGTSGCYPYFNKDCPLYYCCNDQPTDNIEGWLKQEVDK